MRTMYVDMYEGIYTTGNTANYASGRMHPVTPPPLPLNLPPLPPLLPTSHLIPPVIKKHYAPPTLDCTILLSCALSYRTHSVAVERVHSSLTNLKAGDDAEDGGTGMYMIPAHIRHA